MYFKSICKSYIRDRKVRDLTCCFSLVENGETMKPYLYFIRNRLFNNIKFTDIDRYDASLCGASFSANVQEKCQMEQRAVVRSFTFKGLKVKKIEMELTNVYGDEALHISVVKNWRTRFLQGRTKLENDPRSERSTDSDLT
jgi:hypothetical protein